jgi:hypothetical protein
LASFDSSAMTSFAPLLIIGRSASLADTSDPDAHTVAVSPTTTPPSLAPDTSDPDPHTVAESLTTTLSFLAPDTDSVRADVKPQMENDLLKWVLDVEGIGDKSKRELEIMLVEARKAIREKDDGARNPRAHKRRPIWGGDS